MSLKKKTVALILFMEIIIAVVPIGDLICDYSRGMLPIGNVVRAVVLSACVFFSRNKSLSARKRSVFIGVGILILGTILQFAALILWNAEEYLLLGYITLVTGIAYWFGVFKDKKFVSVKTVAIIVIGAAVLSIVGCISYNINTRITAFFNPPLMDGLLFKLMASFNAKIPKISYIIHIIVRTLSDIAVLVICEKYMEEKVCSTKTEDGEVISD